RLVCAGPPCREPLVERLGNLCEAPHRRAPQPGLGAWLAGEQALAEGERVHAVKAKGKNQKAKGKGRRTWASARISENGLVYARVVKLVASLPKTPVGR